MQTFKPQCSMRGAVEVGIKALGREESGQQFCLRSGTRALCDFMLSVHSSFFCLLYYAPLS